MGKEAREVALPRIFVVDDSEAVRETLAIVLGTTHEIHQLSPSDCSASFPVPSGNPDLLIADAESASPTFLRAIKQAGCPVIWLRKAQARNPPTQDVVGPSVVVDFPFDGHALIGHARRLLTQPSRRQPATLHNPLAYPYLTEEAALIANQATTNRLPVLIRGESGTGRSRVAAAIHAAGSSSRFVATSPNGFTPESLEELARVSDDVTVLVDDVGSASAQTQTFLLQIADLGGLRTAHGWLGVRLMSATAADLAAAAHAGTFGQELYYRLSVLPITLPPLRDRPQDIPALARAIASEICSTLGVVPISFTPRAMQRLTRYLWFGNTAELETVLARTISLVHKEVIDLEDLLFGYGRVTSAPASPPTVAASRGPAPAPLASSTVDLIINELAHEFKNPLVTIKTFAQHLDHLLEEEGGHDQLLRLTGEAVDRMDRALENLLQFTRFQEPAPQSVALGTLLGPVLADLGPLLSERRLVLDYRPPPSGATVTVDVEQVAYAVDNLLRTLIRNLPDGEALSVHCGEPGVVVLRLPGNGGRGLSRLASLLPSRGPGEEPPLPLGLALARNLIRRNGGELEVQEGAAGPAITVQLPCDQGTRKVPAKDGTTTSADR